jgi:hypothetical protein
MPIEATEPTVLAATYPYWAFSIYTTGLPLAEPGGTEVGQVSCTATLVKYRTREDGIDERSPLQSDVRTVRIQDIYASMPSRPKIATAFSALMEAVAEEAEIQGKR